MKYGAISTQTQRIKHDIKNDDYFLLIIDFDAFNYFVLSFLDLTAKFTHLLVEGKILKPAYDYGDFHSHRKWAIENKDKLYKMNEYAQYLDEKMEWTESLEENRHFMTHSGSAFLDSKDRSSPTFSAQKKFREKVDEVTGQESVQDHVDRTVKSLKEFIEFYVKYFCNRLDYWPESRLKTDSKS